jgi:hypothetical protein
MGWKQREIDGPDHAVVVAVDDARADRTPLVHGDHRCDDRALRATATIVDYEGTTP